MGYTACVTARLDTKQSESPAKSGLIGALSALACAAPLTAWLWGFSVDDAFIVTRVVQNGLETGLFSFNPGGPLTDAVTPFGFERVVAGVARLAGGPAAAFSSARWLGVIVYSCSVAALGFRLAQQKLRLSSWLVLLVGSSLAFPLAAWSGAGLETPLIGALVLGGLWALESPGRWAWLGCGLWGAAAAWRHELLIAGATSLFLFRAEGQALFSRARLRELALRCCVFLVPVLLVVLGRASVFGSPLPLSFVAKTPDFSSGLRYVIGGTFFGAVPLLLITSSASREGRRALVVFASHLLALLFAGGDWMPFYRLFTPLFPWLLWVAARDAGGPARIGLGLGCYGLAAGLLISTWGVDARAVTERRSGWIAAGQVALRGAERVAAVDVGWLGQATDAPLLDLAGVTDPRVARLPGGHTSKHVTTGFFAREGVDAWVVRAFDRELRPGDDLERLVPTYAVDHRLLREAADWGFEVTAVLPIEGTGGQYVFLRLPPEPR